MLFIVCTELCKVEYHESFSNASNIKCRAL